jgi:hypothetical protein
MSGKNITIFPFDPIFIKLDPNPAVERNNGGYPKFT